MMTDATFNGIDLDTLNERGKEYVEKYKVLPPPEGYVTHPELQERLGLSNLAALRKAIDNLRFEDKIPFISPDAMPTGAPYGTTRGLGYIYSMREVKLIEEGLNGV